MYGYIYRITDLINGKSYIGQHKYDKPMLDPSYHGSSVILKNQIKKHPENFLEEVIFIAATLDELNYFETYFIEHLNTLVPYGYNLNTGGSVREASDATRAKLRAIRKGKTNSGQFKKGQAAWNKGLPKELNPHTGRRHSEEWNLHIKESNKKRYEHEEIKLKISEKVTKYFIPEEELYTLYIVQDLSTQKIAKLYGCTPQAISYKLKKYKISKKTN